MDIQEKEWGSFVEYLKTKGVIKIGRNALGVITNLVREGGCTLGYNDLELMWETWRDAKAQAVPDGHIVVERQKVLDLQRKHKVSLENEVIANEAIDYLDSKLQQAQAVPEGFVLVPREPTEIMAFRGESVLFDVFAEDAVRIYKAMIEAQEQSHV